MDKKTKDRQRSTQPIPAKNSKIKGGGKVTSWEKEYLKILEKLESKPGRVRFSYPDDKRIGILLHELHDESFISGDFYIGPLADVAITYKGRMEIDRLRSHRTFDRLISYAGSAIIFSLGIATTKFFDLLPEIVKHFLNK